MKINSKLYRISQLMRKDILRKVLCLGVGLGIVSTVVGCAKDEDRLSAQIAEAGETANEEYETRKVTLSAEVDGDIEEQLRMMSAPFVQRDGRPSTEQYPSFRFYNTPESFRGGNRTTDALPGHIRTFFPGKATYGDITQEDLDKAPYNNGATYIGGNLHPATLLVYNPEIGEGSVAVTEIKLRAVGTGSKAVLHYSGDINFGRSNDVFGKSRQDGWYSMLFIGARGQGRPNEATLPDSEKGTGVLWRVYQGASLGRTSQYNTFIQDSSNEVSMTNTYHGTFTADFPGVPFASNWTKLAVDAGSATNDMKLEYNTGMKLKMQGALLQYDVVANVSDQIDLRRWGLISNSLDIQGSYYITAKNVVEAFKTKDSEDFGVPGWKAEAPNYTASTTVPNAFFLYKRSGFDPTRIDDAAYAFPWDLPALHTPYTTAQGQKPGIGLGAQELVVSDALYAFRQYMVGSLPATGNGDYNPDRLLTDGGINRRSLPAYRAGSTISGTGRSPFADRPNMVRFIFWGMPRASRSANPATFFFADLHNGRFLYQTQGDFNAMNALKQENYAAQKSMVLHQTNGQFREGRVSHVQTTIESDLMITEVAKDGNYAMLELTNLSHRPVNMENYALVRLVPKTDGNTTRYEYYKTATTSTSNIKEAALLPLALAVSPTNAAGAYKNFTAWQNNGSAINVAGGTFLKGSATGAELQPQYVITFASSAFVDDNNRNQHPFAMGVRNSAVSWKSLAYKGTILDLGEDDQPAFALIRVYDNGRGYRIIDATAPLPTEHNYSEGVSEPYPLNNATSPYLTALAKVKGSSYSIQRKPAVNFPSIFPYRTDLNFSDLWTADKLSLTTGTEDTTVASLGYRSNGERLLDAPQGRSGPKSVANINAFTTPVPTPPYDNWTRTPAQDYNWWASRYSVNIPAAMKY